MFYSPSTGRFYATRAYREVGPGQAKVTGEKFDVTNDIATIVLAHGVTFEKVEEKVG